MGCPGLSYAWNGFWAVWGTAQTYPEARQRHVPSCPEAQGSVWRPPGGSRPAPHQNPPKNTPWQLPRALALPRDAQELPKLAPELPERPPKGVRSRPDQPQSQPERLLSTRILPRNFPGSCREPLDCPDVPRSCPDLPLSCSENAPESRPPEKLVCFSPAQGGHEAYRKRVYEREREREMEKLVNTYKK